MDLSKLPRKKVKKGDTWNPTLTVTQGGSPYDCSSLEDPRLLVKEELLESATEILDITGSWSDASNGIGSFTMTQTQSKALKAKDYFYEAKIYNSGLTFVKTVDQGILEIVEVLEKDLP